MLKAAGRHASAFFHQPLIDYILVTSLSIASFPAESIRIHNCNITPIAQREPRFPLPNILQSGYHYDICSNHLLKSKYQLIKIECSKRSIYDAYENALNELNLLRAIWSFVTMYKQEVIIWRNIALPRPIGVIHTGPIFTLHHTDGRVVNDEFYWYDLNYSYEYPLFGGQESWEKIGSQESWEKIESKRKEIMAKLVELPYRYELEEIMLRYIAALDQTNPNIAFLQLWGILEKITNTVGGKYNQTIERASRIYNKNLRPRMEEILNSLRHYRNRYVHSGDLELINLKTANLLKLILDPHIIQLLENEIKATNLQEYGEYLDYPANIELLTRMIRYAQYALDAEKQDEST